MHMTKRTQPRSVAKYIRRQKALIRREVQDVGERAKKIKDLLETIKQSKK